MVRSYCRNLGAKPQLPYYRCLLAQGKALELSDILRTALVIDAPYQHRLKIRGHRIIPLEPGSIGICQVIGNRICTLGLRYHTCSSRI